MLKYFIFILMIAAGITAKAQTNTSPYTPLDFCTLDTTFEVTFDEFLNMHTEQPFGEEPCEGGQTTLYYSHLLQTSSSGTEWYWIYAGGANINCTVYGPFASVEDGIPLVATNTAPIKFTGSGDTVSIWGPAGTDTTYILKITIDDCAGNLHIRRTAKMSQCTKLPPPCSECLPRFAPRDKQFIVSAWVHESEDAATKTTYATASVGISTDAGSFTFYPSGQIIDGWQRIEGVFSANDAGYISIALSASGDSDVYFDDIRIFPFDGSMMSYVYDPLTLRLVAELDERNYAKLYEYDEEGKLVRVKKETVKGIMTIQENRENSSLK